MMEVRSPAKPLPLTTDGALELFFLGVGSAFTKRHFQTNLLIRKGPDHLVVDFGSKAGQAAFEAGLRVTDLRNFVITHSHADHIGGLEEIALTNRYVTRSKATIYITANYQRNLWSYYLRGGCDMNEKPLLGFRDFFDVVRPKPKPGLPRESYTFTVGGIHITMFRTKHVPDNAPSWRESAWSTGIIVDNRILFTGDTRFDPELLKAFDGSLDLEVIFHDCQFFTGGVHAGIDELVTLPAKIKKRMILVHYGDNWEGFQPRIAKEGFIGLGEQQVIYRFS